MKGLRVAFIIRSTYESVRGGDTIQAVFTAGELKKLGIQVDIFRACDPVDYRRYDLMHLFNLSRPADHLRHITRSRLPYVVSTIYVDYSGFDTHARNAMSRQLFRMAGRNRSEYVKTCYRMFRGQDRLVSRSYLKGHRRAMLKILTGAKMLLPNSYSEYSRLVREFGCDDVQPPYRIIPNGIDPFLFKLPGRNDRRGDLVICVGQIYGLKNQHQLIEATRKLGVRLLIIGNPPPNHGGYMAYCRRIAHPHVQFPGYLPQRQLVLHYARSKVHALPSWFETTGLSSLEAGAMGCNLVVGRGGDTGDYFTNHASFCDADNPEDLEKALCRELNRENSLDFREHILANYTWEKAAAKTRDAYLNILERGT